jgi:hypothetical protein
MTTKVVYVTVNRHEKTVPVELTPLFDDADMMTALAASISSPLDYVHILLHQQEIIHVFSALHYLRERKAVLSVKDFQEAVSEIQRFLPVLDTKELFFIWLSPWRDQLLQYRHDIESIRVSLSIDSQDLLTDIITYEDYIKTRVKDVQTAYTRTLETSQRLCEYDHPDRLRVPFILQRTRVRVDIKTPHSLYFLFDTCTLSSQDWYCAVYKDYMKVHPTRASSVRLTEFDDMNLDELTLFHTDGEQRMSITVTDRPETYTMSIDILPQFSLQELSSYITSHFPGIESIGHLETISVSGVFYIQHYRYEKVLWQDFVMNDPLASTYIYINELERASRQSQNIRLKYMSHLSCIMVNDDNDTVQRPSTFLYFRGKYIRFSIVSAVNRAAVERFQLLLHCLLGRFQEMYGTFFTLYKELLPEPPKLLKFPSAQELSSEPPSPDTTYGLTNYSNKYKYVFKKTGYKTKCRPKTRMPTIISKEEAHTLDPSHVLEFPKDDDTAWNVPKEFLTCRDPAFPFPGVTPLSGGDLFVPCCFYKNPRTSSNYLMYYTGKTTEEKGTEHIKSEYQIIKTFGDLGKLPPSLYLFLTSLVPTFQWFRSGTLDSINSILHSLEWACRKERHADTMDVRQPLVNFIELHPDLCAQETETDALLSLLRDDSKYVDPRLVYRALECMYDINLIVVSKQKNDENISFMVPPSRGFHIRHAFNPQIPVVFLYEHWGTSPERYTKRNFPVCEVIVAMQSPSPVFTLSEDMIARLTEMYRHVFIIRPYPQCAPSPSVDLSHVHAQIFDSWNKVRGLEYSLSPSDVVYIEFEHPHATLCIHTSGRKKRQRTLTIQQLRTFFPTLRVRHMKVYRKNVYAQVILFGVECILHVNESRDGKEVSPVPLMFHASKDHGASTTDLKTSKQYARVLMDYIRWMYVHRTTTDTMLSAEEFVLRHTVIDPEYTYPEQLSELYTQNASFFDTQGRLYVTSLSIQRRLMFTLRQYMFYTPEETTYTAPFLPHFWESALDFSSPYVLKHSFHRQLRPFSVESISLVDLQTSSGLWYMHHERPLPLTSPYVYIRLEREEDAPAYDAYWKAYRSVPRYTPPAVVPSTRVVSFETSSWSTGQRTIDDVFVVHNTHGTFVLLPLSQE